MFQLIRKRTKIMLRFDRILYLWKKFIITFKKDKNYLNVRNHYNYTGKCRGTAHRICTLRFDLVK